MVLYPNKLPESERVCSGICNQRAKTKSELVYLERSRAFVYGYEVGIRPEVLLSHKVALFAEYRFEMLFNSILRNNNHIGLGCVVYL